MLNAASFTYSSAAAACVSDALRQVSPINGRNSTDQLSVLPRGSPRSTKSDRILTCWGEVSRVSVFCVPVSLGQLSPVG